MNGLLDFVKTPEGQGLLSAVAGGLAGARRGAPVNSVGRGLLAGLAGYGNAQDRAAQEQERSLMEQDRQQNRAMRDLQMVQMRAQIDQQQAQQAWKQGLPDVLKQSQETTYGASDVGPTMTPPDPQKLQSYLMDPRSPYADKVIESKLFPKAADYLTVGNTVLQKGPNGLSPVYTAPEKVEKTPLEKALDAAGIVDPAQRAQYLRAGVQKSVTHAPAPSATIINRQETEEAKTVGKFFGEDYAKLQQSGASGQSSINRLGRLEQLLEGVNTGKFAPLGLEVAKAAKAAGLNIDENLSNKEAAVALSSEIALQLRNPAGGAGMPGAMSDADRNFLAGMVPGIEKTPEGRKLIIETGKKLAKRDIDVARLAREYRKKNGSIDEGFYDSLADYSSKNPLFTQSTRKPVRSGMYNGRKVIQYDDGSTEYAN